MPTQPNPPAAPPPEPRLDTLAMLRASVVLARRSLIRAHRSGRGRPLRSLSAYTQPSMPPAGRSGSGRDAPAVDAGTIKLPTISN